MRSNAYMNKTFTLFDMYGEKLEVFTAKHVSNWKQSDAFMI